MINVAHIHPMLVHFPIVFFITGVLISGYVLLRKGDLGERSCLVMTGFSALACGITFALAAAFFGDIALDTAVDAGFAAAPLEEHETLAVVTMVIFGALTLIQGFFLRRKLELKNRNGWIFVGVGLLGLVMLLSTAYHGGNLVYELGVNVSGVKPH